MTQPTATQPTGALVVDDELDRLAVFKAALVEAASPSAKIIFARKQA